MRFDVRWLAAVVLALPAFAHADPDEYVQTPLVEFGVRELDFKYGTRDPSGAQPRESAGSLGLAYGVTPWWFTEAYARFAKGAGSDTHFDEFEWENMFQLTETNQYPVDLGWLVETELPRARDEGRVIVRTGPLIQWDTGALRWNANVFFEHAFDSTTGGSPGTQLQYQAQVSFRLRDAMDAGVQAFGDLGPWDHWLPRDEQNHRIGPALFGKLKLEGRRSIEWNAAWLFGVSKAAADNALRVQAEYEF